MRRGRMISGVTAAAAAALLAVPVATAATPKQIYRDAVVLFYYEKQSYKEMSAILDITPAAVNARLTKARALLRERLGSSP